jgi:cation diffusion facilitator CzcD-associated flavoprotein CzcO
VTGASSAPSAADVVIVGAGPAGLATSRELARAGVDHVVLERGERVGHTWHNLYEGLVLHTGKHLSSLPGMPFPAATPLFPTRRDFVDYLQRYAETFRLPVRTREDVASVKRDAATWVIRTAAATELRSRALVIATGIVANPQEPEILHRNRFRGCVMHSVEYRTPHQFTGRRVLVVGAGNSAGEISVELADAGAHVTLAVRSGARVVPLRLFGVPIQYVAAPLSWLPLSSQRSIAALISRCSELVRGPAVLPPPVYTSCPDVPLIGFHLVDAVRAGRIRVQGGIREFTGSGVRFADGTEQEFDDVILATGYKAALRALGGLITVDDCGFAARRERVVSTDHDNLYFVGHNYDVRGGLRNIALDARRVARMILRHP